MKNDPPSEAEPLTGPASEAPTDVSQWTVHLAARSPSRAVGVALVIGLAAGWAAFLFANPLAFLATAGLLIGAASEFLFPVRYRLTAEFAEARGPLYWRRLEWREVKRVYVGNGEIKLSPLKHGGPREAFRGVVLRFEGDPDRLRTAIRQYREAAAENDASDAEQHGAAPS